MGAAGIDLGALDVAPEEETLEADRPPVAIPLPDGGNSPPGLWQFTEESRKWQSPPRW